MKNLVMSIILCFAIAGCGSGVDVNYDYDLAANFEDYKTFLWVQEEVTSPNLDARQALSRSTLIDSRIKEAVSQELMAKGLEVDEENPDVVVIYHTGIEDQINVTDWGYTYGDYYWGWGGRAIDVYQYQEGTLVVDLISNETKQLVWRGWATKTLSENPTPEQIDATIRDVVAKIFSNYPPEKD